MKKLEGIVSKYLPSDLKMVEQCRGYVKSVYEWGARIVVHYKNKKFALDECFPIDVFCGKKPIEEGDRVIYTFYNTKYGKVDAIIEIKPRVKKELTKKERRELNTAIDVVLSQK